ncbi:MAG: coenzyme F420-reducing hydrogenase, FrhD protein [Methanomicrobiales archaeon HGW-Methanomicrobiales-1]|jgi:coenzyme F420 hydrogenase subunit delta|nr:MAG: coenzyme F420-reducing hydrogenase, FrhD protein [Methanomicrobiales archaeon HGW-Methanomicrobiales-1]
MLYPEIVIVGCGNPLFADDGFGPAVAEEMQKLSLPDNVKVEDGGLGAPHFIFSLLDPEVTKRLIIVDIADFGAEPGSIAKFRMEDLPPGSYRDAHSWDLTEPLERIKDQIDITVIGCQQKYVSDPEMEIGISDEVSKAIPKTVRIVLDMIGDYNGITRQCLQEEHQCGTSETR